jgi:hypothetical protein
MLTAVMLPSPHKQWLLVRAVAWVESREAIRPRPSLLDPYVPISVHTAPDIL